MFLIIFICVDFFANPNDHPGLNSKEKEKEP